MTGPFTSTTQRRGIGSPRSRGSDGESGSGSGVLVTAFLVWFVLVVAWLTWSPFEFGQARNPIRLFPHTAAPDLLGNLALLMPLGIAVALGPRTRPVRTALAAGLLLSTGIELGQILLPGRIVCLADVLLNGAGAALAAWATLRLRDRFSAGRILLTVAAAIYAGIAALALYAGSLFREGVRLEGWDPRYEIAAGDEVGADRRYLGRVWDARVCAGTDGQRECAGPGADLAARTRLVRAAERSQEVEIGARVLSASDTQSGPTRIVTFSRGGYLRNITLGQEGTALVIRIRTPLMGPNGRDFEMRIPEALRAGTPAEVHTRFRHGRVRTTITTAGATRTLDHRFDALSGGILLRSTADLTPVLMRGTRTLGTGILALPLVLLAASRAGGLRGRTRSPKRNPREPIPVETA